jgi:hypothetical protein
MSFHSLRFTDFVKQNIGATHLEIAEFFSREIEAVAGECQIDWRATKTKITWDKVKNKSPAVVGASKEDVGRVYVWAEECSYKQSGVTFTYPFVSFKNMRNTINQPGRKFNALRPLYDAYEKYKATHKIPKNKPKCDPVELLRQDDQVNRDKKELLARQRKVQVAEPKLFARMLPISQPGVFSSYLQYSKKLQKVAEKFDIRIGKNKYGFFTCFELKNIHGETKALQRIYHSPPEPWKDNKHSTWGADTTGLMAIFGPLNEATRVIYICEGLATGLAMNLATDKPVAICISAFNMPFVSAQLAGNYPWIKRVHVADNDNLTPHHGNTGVHAAAVSVKQSGGWVFVPQIEQGTDVCDLYNTEGLEELQRQIYQSGSQYFNGEYSQNIVGLFNYIHARYIDETGVVAQFHELACLSRPKSI